MNALNTTSEIIVCTPYSNIAEYWGTRSALEAEGFTPESMMWPEGFKSVDWSDDNFCYSLQRRRPEGAKGPRKLFVDVDWWMVRIDPIKAKPSDVRYIEIRQKELADIIYRNSAEGRAENDRQCDRYWRSKRDAKFQTFKAMIPGLVAPGRDRKPRRIDFARAVHDGQ